MKSSEKYLLNTFVFLLFLSVYLIFSNQRITTSMDVDVLRYASDLTETGNYGSEMKLSSGVAYSPKTGKFYPQEGIGIVAPLSIFVFISDLITPDSGFILFTYNQFLAASCVLFMFMIFSLFMPVKRAILYTLFFGLGTPLFVHSKYLLPEPMTMLSFTGAIYFILKFIKKRKDRDLFISGLFAGFALICRPDAPIFTGLFSLFAFYIVYKYKRQSFFKSGSWLFAGLTVFTLVFIISNIQRYGSPLETGYTLDRQAVKETLEKDIQQTYSKAKELYSKDQSSKETVRVVGALRSKQQYLEDHNKVINEYGKENTAIIGNGILNYFYGIYLIISGPNRSILFLSPFILLLLIPAITAYKKYPVVYVFTAAVIFSYITLYALRAPLSYAGSAAWGVRYLLPVYPLMFLSVIYLEKSKWLKKKKYMTAVYILAGISIIFQIIGSSVNYQSVQMPLEYKSKQMYGDSDMTWAHKSREMMMIDFSTSLLVNNSRIIFGSLTDAQKEYGVEAGPNDLFFLQVLKGEGRLVRGKENMIGDFKIILFLLLLMLGGSAYYIYSNIFNEN